MMVWLNPHVSAALHISPLLVGVFERLGGGVPMSNRAGFIVAFSLRQSWVPYETGSVRARHFTAWIYHLAPDERRFLWCIDDDAILIHSCLHESIHMVSHGLSMFLMFPHHSPGKSGFCGVWMSGDALRALGTQR